MNKLVDSQSISSDSSFDSTEALRQLRPKPLIFTKEELISMRRELEALIKTGCVCESEDPILTGIDKLDELFETRGSFEIEWE